MKTWKMCVAWIIASVIISVGYDVFIWLGVFDKDTALVYLLSSTLAWMIVRSASGTEK